MPVRKPIVKKPANSNPRPKRLGPFRGSTSQGVIQTLDVGTASGHKSSIKEIPRFLESTRRLGSKGRLYVAVDPLLKNSKKDNYEIHAKRITDFLETLIKQGRKVRHINIDFPEPDLGLYDFKTFFSLIKQVLLPNGKVYITSEVWLLIREISDLAVQNGFIVNSRSNGRKYSDSDFKEITALARRSKFNNKKVNNLPMSAYQRINFGDNSGENPFAIEITYPLRSAIQDKEQRRNWPRV